MILGIGLLVFGATVYTGVPNTVGNSSGGAVMIFNVIGFTAARLLYVHKLKNENLFRDLLIITGVLSYFFITPFVLSMKLRQTASEIAKNDRNAIGFVWPERVAISGPGYCDALCAYLLFSDNGNILGVVRQFKRKSQNERAVYKLYKIVDREVCDDPALGRHSYNKEELQYIYDYAAIGKCLISEDFRGSYPDVEIATIEPWQWPGNKLYSQYQIRQNYKVIAQKTIYLYKVHTYPFIHGIKVRAAYGLARYRLALDVKEDSNFSFTPESMILSMTRNVPPLDLKVYNQSYNGKTFNKYIEDFKTHYNIKPPSRSALLEASIKTINNVSVKSLPLNEIEKEQFKKLRSYLYENKNTPSDTKTSVQATLIRLARLRIEHCTAENLKDRPHCNRNEYFSFGSRGYFFSDTEILNGPVLEEANKYKTALRQYIATHQRNGELNNIHFLALRGAANQMAKEQAPASSDVKMVWDACFEKVAAYNCKILIEKYAVKDGFYLQDVLAKINNLSTRAKSKRGRLIMKDYISMLTYFPNDSLRFNFDEVRNAIYLHYTPGDESGVLTHGDLYKTLKKAHPKSETLLNELLLSEVNYAYTRYKKNSSRHENSHKGFVAQLFNTGCELSIGLTDEDYKRLEDILLERPNLFSYRHYLSYFKSIGRLEEFQKNFLKNVYAVDTKLKPSYFNQSSLSKCFLQ